MTLSAMGTYAVQILGAPRIIRRSRYQNGNPRLDLYTGDEIHHLAELTLDVPDFITRRADADYQFKRTFALIATHTGWARPLYDAGLIKVTGDVLKPSNSRRISACVAQLLFI